eukprot:jgi/Chlat1/4108/Chrsp26S04122
MHNLTRTALHDDQVKALTGRLEQTVTLYNRSALEAQQILSVKEQLLAKWKEETKALVAQFESERHDLKTQVDRLTARVSDLAFQLEHANAARTALEECAGAAERELCALRTAQQTAERRSADLSAQVSVLLDSEETLLRSKQELQAQIDSLSQKLSRAERQQSSMQRRYDAGWGAMDEREPSRQSSHQHLDAGSLKELELLAKLKEVEEAKTQLRSYLRRSKPPRKH